VSPVLGVGVRKRTTTLVRWGTAVEKSQLLQRADIDRRGHEGQAEGISAHGMIIIIYIVP